MFERAKCRHELKELYCISDVFQQQKFVGALRCISSNCLCVHVWECMQIIYPNPLSTLLLIAPNVGHTRRHAIFGKSAVLYS